MASSESSKPSSDIGPSSDSCDKCRPSTCSSSDPYTASSSPSNLCPKCREAEPEDVHIMDLHNLPIGLSKQRHELDLRHDQLTSKLPLELVSYIFTAVVVNEPYDYLCRSNRRNVSRKLLDPVVRLGAVCKRWREITLGTPQLWTKLTITEYNLEQAFYPNVIGQRLHRSHTLPLSLQFDVDCSANEFPDLSYSTVVPLLRSQAHRWNHLSLRVSIPGTMLNTLLTGLEERLILGSLTLMMTETYQSDLSKLEITMKYPFSPKHLVIESVSLPQIPIQWDRLTHLTADQISVDDLVHVFRQAYNLRHCLLGYVQQDAGHYPLPDSPITNVSMKQLKSDSSLWGVEPTLSPLFRHLSLPSLEIFRYGVEEEDHEWVEEEIEVLGDFFDRSQPPLHNFSFYFDIHPEVRGDWYRVLPSITLLELRVRESLVRRNGERTQDLFERLGVHVEPLALPCLREMKIRTPAMNNHSWKALAAMFPDYENNQDPALVVRGPLRVVRIYLQSYLGFNQQTMTGATYSCLLAVQKSGVTLQVFDKQVPDIFGPDATTALSRFLINDEYNDQEDIE